MKRSGCVSIFLAAAVLVPNVARANGHSSCSEGDRGRLLRYERVASYPTTESVRAYFYEWIALYQDFYAFPADLPERFTSGFDSYKVTYCTVDAVLPREREAQPTVATGMGFLSALTNQTTITLPLYMAYILLAYDDIYDVYRRKTDVFRQPYASTVGDLFDMKHFFDDVLAGMPTTTRLLLTPSFAANLASIPGIRCACVCARTPPIAGDRARRCASTRARTMRRPPTPMHCCRSSVCAERAPTQQCRSSRGASITSTAGFRQCPSRSAGSDRSPDDDPRGRPSAADFIAQPRARRSGSLSAARAMRARFLSMSAWRCSTDARERSPSGGVPMT